MGQNETQTLIIKDYWERRAAVQEKIEQIGLIHKDDFSLLDPARLHKNRFIRVILATKNEIAIERIKNLFDPSDISEAAVNKRKSFSLSLKNIIPTTNPVYLKQIDTKGNGMAKEAILRDQILAKEAFEAIQSLHDMRGIIGIPIERSTNCVDKVSEFLYLNQEEKNRAMTFFGSTGFIFEPVNTHRLKFTLVLPDGFSLSGATAEVNTKFLGRSDAGALLSDVNFLLALVSWEIKNRFNCALKSEGSSTTNGYSTRFWVSNVSSDKVVEIIRELEKMYHIKTKIDADEPKTFYVQIPWVNPKTTQTILNTNTIKMDKQKINELKVSIITFLKEKGYNSQHYTSFPLNEDKQTGSISCTSINFAKEIYNVLTNAGYHASHVENRQTVRITIEADSLVVKPAATSKDPATTILSKEVYDLLRGSFELYNDSTFKKNQKEPVVKVQRLADTLKVCFLGGTKEVRQEKNLESHRILEKHFNVQLADCSVRILSRKEKSTIPATKAEVKPIVSSVSDDVVENFKNLFSAEGREKLFGKQNPATEDVVKKIAESYFFIQKDNALAKLFNSEALPSETDVLKLFEE